MGCIRTQARLLFHKIQTDFDWWHFREVIKALRVFIQSALDDGRMRGKKINEGSRRRVRNTDDRKKEQTQQDSTTSCILTWNLVSLKLRHTWLLLHTICSTRSFLLPYWAVPYITISRPCVRFHKVLLLRWKHLVVCLLFLLFLKLTLLHFQ